MEAIHDRPSYRHRLSDEGGLKSELLVVVRQSEYMQKGSSTSYRTSVDAQSILRTRTCALLLLRYRVDGGKVRLASRRYGTLRVFDVDVYWFTFKRRFCTFSNSIIVNMSENCT